MFLFVCLLVSVIFVYFVAVVLPLLSQSIKHFSSYDTVSLSSTITNNDAR